jgi:hypothetical protein
MNDEFKTLQQFDAGSGENNYFHSLPALEQQDIGPISRLPSASASSSSPCYGIATARRSAAKTSNARELERESDGE